MSRAIVVMGVSGCGKTTLGRTLAERLNAPYVEADDHHPAANKAKMASGEPLTDADRWPWLDALGRAIDAAAQANGTCVASCSALKRSYRERLARAIGAELTFVLLDAPRDVLHARLTGRRGHYMPASLLDSQLATLERPEPDEAVIVVDATVSERECVAAALAGLG